MSGRTGALTARIVITLASIAWSLWIRRVTWHCRREVAATVNITLQGCAVALMSPFASETLRVYLHDLTGKWNREDYIGHDYYVVAAGCPRGSNRFITRARRRLH
ncbi:MAG: hypothetical protein QOD36_390 [Mycobacterium sp.]|jgi:hypothetical protein|nr:hypothetical protein [Mycobacterium sp.]